MGGRNGRKVKTIHFENIYFNWSLHSQAERSALTILTSAQMRQYSLKNLMDGRYFLPGTLPLLLWSFSPKEYHLIVLCGKTVFVQSSDPFLSCKEVFSSINRNVENNILNILPFGENVASRNSNKNLMLIAVYSCNPFEDYHGITIQYNFLCSVLTRMAKCFGWIKKKMRCFKLKQI